jgi:peptidoglycan/LPS O-acetylase OafA/YrhL
LITQENFRQDINGLRALAVLAVVFYHFQIAGFAGGFIGVDIFFVISGFLMTKIIVSAHAADRFSLSSFYLARAKRIVPALLVMITLLLIVAWFLPLTPHEYKQLAKHARDSALFVSNHTYARESGYFAAASHEKWLLHTWSLSVEWQFYLLLPVIFLAFKKIQASAPPKYLLIPILIASFVACVAPAGFRSETTFFFLPFRAWELVAGGLTYLFTEQRRLPQRVASSMAWVSVIALVLAAMQLSSAEAWPGWWTLLPIAASCLIIAARHDSNPLLGNRVAQWIGLRSYSIYLWHWPLVVGLGLYGWQDNPWAIMAALAVTLLAGAISYRFVEIPARMRSVGVRPSRLWLAFAAAVAGVATPAGWLQGQDALPQRTKAQTTLAYLTNLPPFDTSARAACFDGSLPDGCHYGKGPVGAIMIGDSHAGVTASALSRITAEHGLATQLWSKGACMTVLGIESIDRTEGARCMDFNQQLFDRLSEGKNALPIVIVNRGSLYPFGHFPTETHLHGRRQAILPGISPQDQTAFLVDYRQRLIETACRYAKDNRQLFYLLPIPEFPVNIPNTLARSLMRFGPPARDITMPLADYYQRNEFVIAALKEANARCDVQLLDPVPYLCDAEKCFGSKEGQPLYTDNNHINERGRQILAPMFRALFAPRP